MNLKYYLKSVLWSLVAVVGMNTANAQLSLQYNQTATQLAQSLVGDGVIISNAQITGADSSYAHYVSTGTEIGSHNGVLLTTGRAAYAVGPNNSIGWCTSPGFNNNGPPCSYFDRNTPGSALLEDSQQSNCNLAVCTQDACMLEFDIVPQGYDLRFAYTFASEEYKEWVNSSFNDVFGFYISGPGIGTDVNIALIPNTSQYVAINNVNHLVNTQYFYDNQIPYGQQIQYDGFTRNLEAYVNGLTPCATYHLKLVIADGVDGTYESGVFVQAIQSSPVVVLTATSNGLDYMVEGCNTGTITFSREEAAAFPQDVTFFVGGTATNGVDYTPSIGSGVPMTPTTITIPANQTSASLSISALADGNAEGMEYLTIYLDNPACTGNEIIDSVNFYLYDVLQVEITPENPLICLGECVTLTAATEAASLGSFVWSGGTVSNPNSLVVDVCPTVETTYTLTATVGACTASDEVIVSVSDIAVTLDAINSQCFSNGAGSITPNVTDAIAPLSFAWTGPNGFTSTDENLTGLAPGEYCVTVTDAAGCSAEACVTIIQTNELTVNADFSDFTCTPISCFNACDGAINLILTGGAGNFQFNWAGPNGYASTDQNISNLCAGDYEVTVSDGAGCEVIQTYTLLQPDSLVITVIGTTDLLCTGVETGQATVNADGGCAPYTFNWAQIPGLTGPIASNLGSGTYEVSVSDVNNCTSQGAVTIVINDPIDPLTVVVDSISLYPGGFNTSCPGSEDGFVDLIVTGGSLPYTYSWYSDTEEIVVSNDEDLTGVACGDYTVTVTDDNGCVFTQSFTLTCVPAIGANYTVVSNPCGAPLAGIGEISVSAFFGGHGEPYTFSWDGPSCPCPADSTITGLNSGDYQLNITDSLGCVTSLTINVGQNDQFTATGAVTDNSCFNSCDGAIDVIITPPGTYNFAWTGPFDGPAPTTEDVSGLCAGTYQVTISADECSETFTFTVNEPEEVTIDAVITNPVCFGQNDGAIDITVNNGSGEYTYDWSAPNGCFFNGSTDQDIQNLFECAYTVTVTDTITDCVVTQTFTLDAPEVITISVSLSEVDGGYNVSCNGGSDGAISVFANGGTPDCNTYAPECYLYDWTGAECAAINPTDFGNAPGASSITGLPAGNYGVIVYDINGCIATTCIDLTEPEPIESTPTIDNIECADPAGGSINPGISGGSGLYFYNWTGNLGSNASNAPVLIGVPAGTFTLVVSDSNGCSETYTYEVTETVPPTVTTVEVIDAGCNGACDGSISVMGESQNGDSLTAYYNDALIGLIASGDTLTVDSLCAGPHVFRYVDANGCETEVTITVGEPEPVVITLTSVIQNDEQQTDLQCKGDSTGQLIASVTGGTPNYSYFWYDSSNTLISDSTSIIGLTAGNYCLAVYDANGCMDSICYEITEPEFPLAVSDSVTVYQMNYNISCYNANDGYIEVEVTGGIPTYDLNWTGVGVVDGQLSQSGLGAGHYELLVTDINGCSILLEWDLTEPAPIIIDPITVNQPTCFESCNGSIEITVAGGEGPYTYSWTGPDGFNSTDQDIDNLCAGTYDLLITDAIGCTATLTQELIDPTPLVVVIDQQYDCATGNYELCALASGGTPTYTYQWTQGATTQCITAVVDGEYCVTVIDANGCETTVCVTIDVNEVLAVNGVTVNASCGQCNGAIDITITGGAAPLSIDWSGTGTVDGQEDQVDLCEGAYTVTITDANGCTATATFNVDQNDPIDAQLSVDNVNCFGNSDGSAALAISGATGNVIITWFDAQGNQIGTGTSIAELSAGAYSAQWIDEAGCSGEENFVVTQPQSLGLSYTVSQFGEYNIGATGATDGFIQVNVSGGTPAYTYDWSPIAVDDTTTHPMNLGAGTYTVTITDANGCAIDTTITLTQPEELRLPTGLSPNGDGFNDTYYIPGAYLCKGSTFKVFNRWGNLVYEKDNYDNDWYGQTKDGGVLADGTYFVLFEGCDKEFQTYVDLRRE